MQVPVPSACACIGRLHTSLQHDHHDPLPFNGACAGCPEPTASDMSAKALAPTQAADYDGLHLREGVAA